MKPIIRKVQRVRLNNRRDSFKTHVYLPEVLVMALGWDEENTEVSVSLDGDKIVLCKVKK